MKYFFVLIATLLVILFPSFLGADDCAGSRKLMNAAKKADLHQKKSLYLEAVRLSPSCAEAHNNLGDVYERLGKLEAAIKEYKITAALAPGAAIPCFGLGDIYFKSNRYAKAIIWYQKGLKLEPGDRVSRRRLALLQDMKNGGVIKKGTLVRMLTLTRGAGDAATISFGENLVPFAFDKANIRRDAEEQLTEIGQALQEVLGIDSQRNRSTRAIGVVKEGLPAFQVVGHTDVRGGSDYNKKLSLNRAANVVKYLVERFNIPRHLLIPVGMGKKYPLCGSGTETCHALNRRVEIRRVNGG